MGYTCTKPFKVQKADGTMELRRPGQPVPEAAGWANPALWIKRGFIQADDHETAKASGYARDRLEPMREATAADAKRAEAHVPMPNKPLPGSEPDGGEGEGEGLSEDQDTKSELMKLRRDELEGLASEQGIEDPAEYPNKEALADAILEAAGE